MRVHVGLSMHIVDYGAGQPQAACQRWCARWLHQLQRIYPEELAVVWVKQWHKASDAWCCSLHQKRGTNYNSCLEICVIFTFEWFNMSTVGDGTSQGSIPKQHSTCGLRRTGRSLAVSDGLHGFPLQGKLRSSRLCCELHFVRVRQRLEGGDDVTGGAWGRSTLHPRVKNAFFDFSTRFYFESGWPHRNSNCNVVNDN